LAWVSKIKFQFITKKILQKIYKNELNFIFYAHMVIIIWLIPLYRYKIIQRWDTPFQRQFIFPFKIFDIDAILCSSDVGKATQCCHLFLFFFWSSFLCFSLPFYACWIVICFLLLHTCHVWPIEFSPSVFVHDQRLQSSTLIVTN